MKSVVSHGLRAATRQQRRLSQPTCLRVASRLSSTSAQDVHVSAILKQVEEGQLSASAAESLLTNNNDSSKTSSAPTDMGGLQSFANLDHKRTKRTGFPEAVFSEGKSAAQIRDILEDMAKHVNKAVENGDASVAEKAILATRVNGKLYEEVCVMPLQNGTITYHETANLISMRASSLDENAGEKDNNSSETKERNTVVVACAGTTDLPVAEEAAITLEAAGCNVERIYDVGVAGLHRIINALPRLRHPNVRCVIVCAGMDGALPSVVAGLVTVPVVAVPTSVGYGAAFGGVSAMLTMLNSCAPGVGIVVSQLLHVFVLIMYFSHLRSYQN
jgi:NCAIR mutase (PurE)-related protein